MFSALPASAIFSFSRLTIWLVLLVTPIYLFADQSEESENSGKKAATLQDSTVELVQKISGIAQDGPIKEKQAAVQELQNNLANVPPNSYDSAVTNLLLAQTLVQMQKASEAIPAMEQAVFSGFFDAKQNAKYTLFLANLYYQEQPPQLKKAQQTIARFLGTGAEPTSDMLYFYAAVLIADNQAEEALKQAEKLFRMEANPKDDLLRMAVACNQELKRFEVAASYLELLLDRKPDNASYWDQLVSSYAQAGQTLAALLTIERAQKAGFKISPIDNQSRVELYFNLEQYAIAAQLMKEGLANGTIPSELRNWNLLSYCYELLKDKEGSLYALEEASKLNKWPDIDVRLARAYWERQRTTDTVQVLLKVLKFPDLKKPGEIWLFLATAYLDTRDFPKASDACDQASKDPEIPPRRIEDIRKYIAKSINTDTRPGESGQ